MFLRMYLTEHSMLPISQDINQITYEISIKLKHYTKTLKHYETVLDSPNKFWRAFELPRHRLPQNVEI